MKSFLIIFSLFLSPILTFSQNQNVITNNNYLTVNTSFGKLINYPSSQRYKVAVNNILPYRIGSYFLFENSLKDKKYLIGFNINLKYQTSINLGYEFGIPDHILYGPRKEIGINYTFKKIPIILNTSYSSDMGISINIGYQIYIYKPYTSNLTTPE